jgi:hypothetical protein
MRDWSKNLRRRSKSRGISGSHWRRRSYSTSNFLGPGLISGLPLELLLVSNQPARLIMLRVMHCMMIATGEGKDLARSQCLLSSITL